MSETAYRANEPSRVRAYEETTTFTAGDVVAWSRGAPRDDRGRGYVASVASLSPLRQRLIDEGLLRPDRNEALAPEPRDRLFVVHVPSWVRVFRLVDVDSSPARCARARSN